MLQGMQLLLLVSSSRLELPEKQLQDKDDMALICLAAMRNEEAMCSMHLKEVQEVKYPVQKQFSQLE